MEHRWRSQRKHPGLHPELRKRIAAEEQPTAANVQEPPANSEGSFTAAIKKKKIHRRLEAVVVGESIWSLLAAHKGSGGLNLLLRGSRAAACWLVVMWSLSPMLPPGESGGGCGASLHRRRPAGSAGLTSSDVIALPSAESSQLEEDESGAGEEDSAEERRCLRKRTRRESSLTPRCSPTSREFSRSFQFLVF